VPVPTPAFGWTEVGEIILIILLVILLIVLIVDDGTVILALDDFLMAPVIAAICALFDALMPCFG